MLVCRFKIRGVKHIVFYDLPIYSHFYSELCNMLADSPRGAEDDIQSCTVLYSRFDVLKLSAIVGMERASRMVNSDKQIHMIVSGD
jgi:U3 small nucleolar RNA-associated protein 25